MDGLGTTLGSGKRVEKVKGCKESGVETKEKDF